MNTNNILLSEEQNYFITKALEGNNILVDACIGSGKTTAIQHLCNRFPSNNKILYLTYNKLLKVDAKSKIKNKNVTVTNYHSFAYSILKKLNITIGVTDLIQQFNKAQPQLEHYDTLIIDEYQDIDLELSQMLEYIKQLNANIQIIAVGDMQQKIYDKTTLDIFNFINVFLGTHLDMQFTQCFRLSASLAEKLGRIWNKRIVGVNDSCIVEEMDKDSVITFLSNQNPQDILCLGSRHNKLSEVLNILETQYPEKFNKKTVYASISDHDGGTVTPKKTSAIFTTFDSSKGLERKICVVFDFTEKYWQTRINKPQQSFEILKNIFCVAASRGKEHIIFVKDVKDCETLLTEKTLSFNPKTKTHFSNINISDMYDFKYKEDVEECFNILKITYPPNFPSKNDINISDKDNLIDLSPCIGVYQEAMFFKNYDIDMDINLQYEIDGKSRCDTLHSLTLNEKILLLTSLKTKQNRYRTQVDASFISDKQSESIFKRLNSHFTPNENVQIRCEIPFADEDGKYLFSAIGFVDVLKNDVVYELKYVNEVTHEHFLQCATYMIALGLEKGVLYNTRYNELYTIEIPDKKLFLDTIAKTITKRFLKQYTVPREKEQIAIIDTETNFNNNVMSIAVVIANAKEYTAVDSKYYIISPEWAVGGMYSYALITQYKSPIFCSRQEALLDLINTLKTNHVSKIFAYNASFDYNLLPELSSFNWFDIMKLAANRNFNSSIPADADCFKTGKLKRNYGVESIYQMLSGNPQYHEIHNAWEDANDELKIMLMLQKSLDEYSFAQIVDKNIRKTTSAKKEQLIASKPIINDIFENHNRTNQVNINKQEMISHLQENHYTVKESCDILGTNSNEIYLLIKNGKLPAKKIKNTYYISKDDLDTYINQQKKAEIIAFKIFLSFIALILVLLLFFPFI